MTVLPHPVVVDPLIAEAKQRARRRRFLAVGALVAVAVGAVAYGLFRPGHSGTSATSSLPKSLVARLALAAREQGNVRETGSAGGGVFYAGTDDALWLTTDDGRTWRHAPHGVGLGSIDFINRRDGWIQWSWWIYRTTDGARSWIRSPIPSTHVPGTSSSVHNIARSMSFVNRTDGFLSLSPAKGFGPFRVFATDDGGATWQPRGRLPLGTVFARQFDDAQTGFTRSASTVYSTADAGRTWSAIRPSPPCAGVLAGGRFGGALQIWHCGRSLHVTTNGGSSWIVRRAPRSALLKNFDALSARTWVGGFSGRHFFMTTSAGRTWVAHRLATPPHWAIAFFRFSSPHTGWAIFGHEPPGGGASLYRGLFGPPTPQFLATVLMRTTDGGRTWTPAGPPKQHRQ